MATAGAAGWSRRNAEFKPPSPRPSPPGEGVGGGMRALRAATEEARNTPKRKTSYGSAGASPYRWGALDQADQLLSMTARCRHTGAGPDAAQSAGLADDGQAIQARGFDLLRRAARPENFHRVDMVGVAQANRDRQFGLGKITARGHHLTGQGLVADANFDPRANRVAVALGADQFQAEPVMVKLLIVAQEQRRAVDLGHDDVEVAVAIDVGEGGAAADDGFEDIAAAFLRGHRHETHALTGAAVPKKLRRLAIRLAGMDFLDFLFDVAVGRQDVEAAIQVVIEEEQAEF